MQGTWLDPPLRLFHLIFITTPWGTGSIITPVLEVRWQILSNGARFLAQAAQPRTHTLDHLVAQPKTHMLDHLAAQPRAHTLDHLIMLLNYVQLTKMCQGSCPFVRTWIISVSILLLWPYSQSIGALLCCRPYLTHIQCFLLQESDWQLWRCSANGWGCSTGTVLGPHHHHCRPTGDRWASAVHPTCPSAGRGMEGAE